MVRELAVCERDTVLKFQLPPTSAAGSFPSSADFHVLDMVQKTRRAVQDDYGLDSHWKAGRFRYRW